MSGLPETIRHPAAFSRSPAAGADGVLHWDWVNRAFSDTKITATDWDGVVERRGQFLVVESKDEGCDVPGGQLITLRQAHAIGCFCILFVWGKETPSRYEVWYPGRKAKSEGHCDAETLTTLVSKWRAWAEKNPHRPVDVRFLNRRITHLEKMLDAARIHAEALVCALGGSVTWDA
jgi:hypothetical protein